eukprot:Skav203259  [mRNA]  locus=scaffold2987:6867:8090:+ [translate_table: standard]
MASSILDSVATFEKQAKAVGLADEWIQALKTSHIDTLGKLSYAVCIPGSTLTDADVRTFANSARPGVALTIASNSALKRLIFEAQTFAIAALKAAVHSTDVETPKKLAAPERQVRFTKFKADFPGLDITGPLEPAHALYDLCMTIYETEEMRYIPPSKCLSRQQELAGMKPEKEVQLDAAKGSLVIKDVQNKQEITISSDLALSQAFTRRALAFELVGLASFNVVNKWHNRMLAMMAQSPAPGFQKVSQGQLLRADRQAFVRMGELCNGVLKPNAAGVKPLDAIIESMSTDVSVTYFLLPMPVDSSSGTKEKQASPDKPDKAPKRPSESGSHGSTKIQKGKGKGKSKKRDPMPSELRGMMSRTKEGKEICYSFNLGRCKLGDKCPRAHVCCVPGCGKHHPQFEHEMQ